MTLTVDNHPAYGGGQALSAYIQSVSPRSKKEGGFGVVMPAPTAGYMIKQPKTLDMRQLRHEAARMCDYYGNDQAAQVINDEALLMMKRC
ncbi:MAG: hypothetical protein KTR20_13685 [Cellvibrionaceae bacterium]|nr:hypothetical protein [Cellvibrionaceae bacterium]